MKGLNLSILTILHFCVDLSCIYYLLANAAVRVPDHETWLFFAVLYNFMAFGLPLCIGVLSDLRDRTTSYAAAGFLLVWFGFLCRSSLPLSIVLLGTGNGLFHIGGGRKVLLDGGSRCAPGGIFISAGAIGVFLGRCWGGHHLVINSFFEILLPICAVLLLAAFFLEKKLTGNFPSRSDLSGMVRDPSYRNEMTADRNNTEPVRSEARSDLNYPQTVRDGRILPELTICISLFLLFAVIFLRSLYGSLTVYTWNSGLVTGLVFTICIAAGKFSGGIIADRIGLKRTIAVSLICAGILAIFSFSYPICGMISILCFNMTMPVSLSLLDRLLNNKPGSAFGILMMALFLGTLPGMLGNVSAISSPAGLAAMCGLSLLILLGAAIMIEKKGARL